MTPPYGVEAFHLFFKRQSSLCSGSGPANTILAYRDAIKLLLCYVADTVNISVDQLAVQDIDEKMVLGFLDDCRQRRGCSPRTRNARLAAIRSLFD